MQNKHLSMKHGELDSLTEEPAADKSTLDSENKRKMLEKKKISTSSLPESLASSKVYEVKPKVYEEKLCSFFEHPPR